jgi:hypothetical protein
VAMRVRVCEFACEGSSGVWYAVFGVDRAMRVPLTLFVGDSKVM